MFITKSSKDEGASALGELVCFSSKAATSKSSKGSRLQRVGQTDTKPAPKAKTERSEAVSNHAAPVSPLRERDLFALAEMFEQENGDEIEEDIMQYLHLLCPEPCWEEDLFEFLREYL